jgi:hypothetical protein
LNGAIIQAKHHQEQDNDDRCSQIKLTGHPAAATPFKEDVLKLKWAKRDANPTCLHFGIDTNSCQAGYPSSLFCRTVTNGAIIRFFLEYKE